MATSKYEVDTALVLLSSIDINGGLGIFGVSCPLCEFCEIGVRLTVKVLKSVVLNRLHHREPGELLIGLQNVFQITQVRTQP